MSDEVPLQVQNHAADTEMSDSPLLEVPLPPTQWGQSATSHSTEAESTPVQSTQQNESKPHETQQSQSQAPDRPANTGVQIPEAKQEADAKSVYVGNVDYAVTQIELQSLFSQAGEVERVTIMINKATGQPKGFAYVEFKLPAGAQAAVDTLNGYSLHERELKVNLKRTNVPGFNARGGFRGRARGGRPMFRGRGRGAPRGRGAGRGDGRFAPY